MRKVYCDFCELEILDEPPSNSPSTEPASLELYYNWGVRGFKWELHQNCAKHLSELLIELRSKEKQKQES